MTCVYAARPCLQIIPARLEDAPALRADVILDARHGLALGAESELHGKTPALRASLRVWEDQRSTMLAGCRLLLGHLLVRDLPPALRTGEYTHLLLSLR